ncbi:hypothetical protein [Rhizosphaericola mali]|uniref:Uncharacterized protein n=1 Tax=Rhizosphaericola mali TaxID=2545455 RepID=A0A5P2G2S2_9BACT|nr:hypothetical protein [Rhizosphaericola mali]QES88100.1 hypothetical protein E0W69_005275 [Rhizosphaericola mali]
MKKNICRLILLSAILFGTNSHAQFLNNIKEKIQNKLTNINPTKHATVAKDSILSNPNATEVFSVSGNRILFKDDFSNDKVGSMPKHWKSNIGGSVIVLPNQENKWFLLEPSASYRLDSVFNLPNKFALEFDLYCNTTDIGFIKNLDMGFTPDNSAQSYQYAVSSNVNGFVEFATSSNQALLVNKQTESNGRIPFKFDNYTNSKIHLSLLVEGKNIKVFWDGKKLFDKEDFFQLIGNRHFFISTDPNMKENAQLCIGNFLITGFE